MAVANGWCDDHTFGGCDRWWCCSRLDPAKRSEEFAVNGVSRAISWSFDAPSSPQGACRGVRHSRVAILISLGLWALSAANSAHAVTVKTFPLFKADSQPIGIALGPDGNMWFTEYQGSRVGRVTPDGKVDDWSTGSGISAAAGPLQIAAGPDGNLWFTEDKLQRIGRITPTAQPTATEFPLNPQSGSPNGIAAGPDGNLWFTQSDRVGRITPSGSLKEFTQGISAMSGLGGITAGPDGNLWFTESRGRRIGSITPAGVVTEFSAGISPDGAPSQIALGPDGNLWFTEVFPSRIGRITTSGVITEFSDGITPGLLGAIVAGPDGNMWFSNATGVIARISMSGAVTEFPVGDGTYPTGIATGSDGRIWFTATLGNAVGRVTLDPVVTTGDANVVAPTAASMSGTVNPLRSPTTYVFEYGPTTAYGSTTAAQPLPSVAATIPVGGAAGGLTPGTTYHYRLVATNEGGKTLGADRTLALPSAQSGGPGGTVTGGPRSAPNDRSGPRMSIVNRVLVLSASHRVRVTVRCPRVETFGCHGSVRIEVPGKPSARRLGAGRFRMGGGQSREVQVTIAASRLSPLRGNWRKRVRVVVNGVDAAGNVTTTAARVALLGTL